MRNGSGRRGTDAVDGGRGGGGAASGQEVTDMLATSLREEKGRLTRSTQKRRERERDLRTQEREEMLFDSDISRIVAASKPVAPAPPSSMAPSTPTSALPQSGRQVANPPNSGQRHARTPTVLKQQQQQQQQQQHHRQPQFEGDAQSATTSLITDDHASVIPSVLQDVQDSDMVWTAMQDMEAGGKRVVRDRTMSLLEGPVQASRKGLADRLRNYAVSVAKSYVDKALDARRSHNAVLTEDALQNSEVVLEHGLRNKAAELQQVLLRKVEDLVCEERARLDILAREEAARLAEARESKLVDATTAVRAELELTRSMREDTLKADSIKRLVRNLVEERRVQWRGLIDDCAKGDVETFRNVLRRGSAQSLQDLDLSLRTKHENEGLPVPPAYYHPVTSTVPTPTSTPIPQSRSHPVALHEAARLYAKEPSTQESGDASASTTASASASAPTPASAPASTPASAPNVTIDAWIDCLWQGLDQYMREEERQQLEAVHGTVQSQIAEMKAEHEERLRILRARLEHDARSDVVVALQQYATQVQDAQRPASSRSRAHTAGTGTGPTSNTIDASWSAMFGPADDISSVSSMASTAPGHTGGGGDGGGSGGGLTQNFAEQLLAETMGGGGGGRGAGMAFRKPPQRERFFEPTLASDGGGIGGGELGSGRGSPASSVGGGSMHTDALRAAEQSAKRIEEDVRAALLACTLVNDNLLQFCDEHQHVPSTLHQPDERNMRHNPTSDLSLSSSAADTPTRHRFFNGLVDETTAALSNAEHVVNALEAELLRRANLVDRASLLASTAQTAWGRRGSDLPEPPPSPHRLGPPQQQHHHHQHFGLVGRAPSPWDARLERAMTGRGDSATIATAGAHVSSLPRYGSEIGLGVANASTSGTPSALHLRAPPPHSPPRYPAGTDRVEALEGTPPQVSSPSGEEASPPASETAFSPGLDARHAETYHPTPRRGASRGADQQKEDRKRYGDDKQDESGQAQQEHTEAKAEHGADEHENDLDNSDDSGTGVGVSATRDHRAGGGGVAAVLAEEVALEHLCSPTASSLAKVKKHPSSRARSVPMHTIWKPVSN